VFPPGGGKTGGIFGGSGGLSGAEGVLERAGSQRGLSTLAFPGSLWEASGSRQVREGVVFGRRGRGSRAAADFFSL
jgi:hypothetical protein